VRVIVLVNLGCPDRARSKHNTIQGTEDSVYSIFAGLFEPFFFI